jgi:hypothetical protein
MIISGKQKRPQKVLIYGVEGIGKSTFAAQFPEPVFIDTENRTAHLDIDRIPCRDFDTFQKALEFVAQSDKQTIIIDTVDWLERLIQEHLCLSEGKESIEDFGYGKGYKKVGEVFQGVIKTLEQTMPQKHIVFVAHCKMKRFDCPITNQSYDRYQLNTGEIVSAQAKEWLDTVLFINWDDTVYKDVDKKVKATGGRGRIAYAQRCAAYDAKNSWGLPQEFPLDYKTIAPHIPDMAETPEQKERRTLRAEILELAKPYGNKWLKKLLGELKFDSMTIEQIKEFRELVLSEIEIENLPK